MKFNVNKEAISAAMQTISSVVPGTTSNTDTIYDYAHFSGSDGVVTVTASKQGSGITVIAKFDAEFPANFVDCVPIKKTTQLVKLLNDEVEISREGSRVKFKSGNSVQRIATREPKDFPLPTLSTEGGFETSAETLKKMLNHVHCALSRFDQGNYPLASVHIKVLDGNLRIYTCDGTQAARAVLKLDKHYDFDALIPMASLAPVLNMMSYDPEDKIRIVKIGNNVEFSSRRGTLIVRTRAETFPPVDMLIIDKLLHRVVIDRDELIQCISRVLLFSDKQGVNFTATDTHLLIESTATSDGDSSEIIEIDDGTVSSQPVQFSFFGNHLVAAVKELKGKFKLDFGNRNQIMVQPGDQAELGFDFHFVTATKRSED